MVPPAARTGFTTPNLREASTKRLPVAGGCSASGGHRDAEALAGSESAMDAFVNDVRPEEAARMLREVPQ